MNARQATAIVIVATIMVLSGLLIAQPPESDEDGQTIGVAWRTNMSSESFVNTVRSLQEAGGNVVIMEQVVSYDLDYNGSMKLTEGIDSNGMLDLWAADIIKDSTWSNSNVKEVLKGIDFVVFPGGDDISSTLYAKPQEWAGPEEDKQFDPERDVSDYIAMSYCLDMDIPFVAICRGMQMLSVVSGAEMAQDIPTYFNEQSAEYHDEHRNQMPYPGGYRDYASHDVLITEGSMIHKVMGKTHLRGCPSWHHQMVVSVEGTQLRIAGLTDTNGIQVIESVERMDKTCAFGVQYHPEASVVKNLDDIPNKDDYMSYEDAIALFEWIVAYR